MQITFSTNLHIISYNYAIRWNDLAVVSHIKNLDILIDNKLFFDLHLDNICKKAYRMLGFIIQTYKNFKNRLYISITWYVNLYCCCSV